MSLLIVSSEPMPQFKIKRIPFIVIVGLVVCCVVMQMVGIQASLWDSSHIADNSVGSSILGANALVTDSEDINILSVIECKNYFCPTSAQRVFLVSIFHPPDFS
jgi:hypothetical protein